MLICSIFIIIFSFLFIIFCFIFIMFGYELFCVEFFESDSVKYYIESRKNATNQTCPDIWTIHDLAKYFSTSNISKRILTLRKYVSRKIEWLWKQYVLCDFLKTLVPLLKSIDPERTGTNRNNPVCHHCQKICIYIFTVIIFTSLNI